MPLSATPRRLRSRTAFTLIELLVVIAIIAVLIGLLLPAIQKVREAANRMVCVNNLKQLALAAHNFHSANGAFPRGAVKYRNYSPAGSSNLVEYDRYTWALLLLPFIEQDNLYNGYQQQYFGPPGAVGVRSSGTFTLPNTGDLATGAIAAQPVKTFLCPSDPAIGGTSPYGVATDLQHTAPAGNAATWSPTAGFKPLPPGDPGYWQWGITSYQGNGGTASYGVLKLYSPEAVADGQNDSRDGTIYLWQYFNGNGAVNAAGSNNIDARYTVNVSSISDGTSNTFLFGEKSLYDPGYAAECLVSQNALIDQSFWANPSGQDTIAGCEFPLNSSYQKLKAALAGGCNDGENVAGTDAVSCACDARTTNFSSNHKGGVNFAFADGSVHFVSENIALVTLRALSTRAGGEVITDTSSF
jgi:prepilin-type N-terminal cleavage/methylation domain-containing protein/prepilin-type processing-associated H-X9-DG protein